jgi:hypothetical protein
MDLPSRPPDAGPPAGERRASARRPCNQEIALRPLPAGGREAYWASVQNVSAGGVGLLLSHFFPPGTTLALELPGRRAEGLRLIAAKVVHARTRPHGNASLGCAFAGDPGDAALQALGAAGPARQPPA